MTALPFRLGKDRIDTSEEAIEAVEEIQEEYADGQGFTVAYTDAHIDSEVCINLINQSHVFLVPESMTRRNLGYHSMNPP